MDSNLSLSFEGAEEIRTLFAEAGAQAGARVRITLEALVSEMAEDGVVLVPDAVELVESVAEAEEVAEEGVDPEPGETPGMVVVMEERGE
jgi:hypothetical protein